MLHRSTSDLVQHVVRPLTAEARCRLLDLVPHELRGQPHHYVAHAWSGSARELLQVRGEEVGEGREGGGGGGGEGVRERGWGGGRRG